MNDQIQQIISNAKSIVILQADNPDADSLGSSLALEELLAGQNKIVTLYCGVDIPGYLRHIRGWDRVQTEIPHKFDASIVVDASTMTLFEKLQNSGQQGWIASKPCIVLDHHDTTDNSIHFADATLIRPELSSTGELIYELALAFGWHVNQAAGEHIMQAILGDTQGLSNSLASAETYRAVAALLDIGVDRQKLEEARREFTKMDPRIYAYKASLISRTEFHVDGQLALVTIPQAEINEFSPLYNPAPLIQGDMLQTIGVKVALVFKSYDDGKILCSIRANSPIAAKLAEHFGGGGHDYASGFKISGGMTLDQVKSSSIEFAAKLLNNEGEDGNEAI